MKIVYNVTIKIETDYKDEWLEWNKNIHIPEVLATGHFESYRITRILGDDDQYGVSFAIQYIAASLDLFLEYQKNHAPQLQKKHSDRFENKYVAFRTVMEIIHEG